MEDKLLDGDGRTDTPAPTPPGTPPNESATGKDLSKAVTPDAIEKRCQQIFGKRPATSDIGNAGTSAKVVNVDSSMKGATDNKPPPAVPTDAKQNPPPAIDNVNNNGDNGKAADKSNGDNDVGDNRRASDMEVSDDDDGPANENGQVDPWAGQNDDPPILYPAECFPTAPPQYPAQPSFNYRYRSGAGSTPRRRRQDFTRAIVLRNVKRDPHTNRISNEDYEAREDSEMQLSLGYVDSNQYNNSI